MDLILTFLYKNVCSSNFKIKKRTISAHLIAAFLTYTKDLRNWLILIFVIALCMIQYWNISSCYSNYQYYHILPYTV